MENSVVTVGGYRKGCYDVRGSVRRSHTELGSISGIAVLVGTRGWRVSASGDEEYCGTRKP